MTAPAEGLPSDDTPATTSTRAVGQAPVPNGRTGPPLSPDPTNHADPPPNGRPPHFGPPFADHVPITAPSPVPDHGPPSRNGDRVPSNRADDGRDRTHPIGAAPIPDTSANGYEPTPATDRVPVPDAPFEPTPPTDRAPIPDTPAEPTTATGRASIPDNPPTDREAPARDTPDRDIPDRDNQARDISDRPDGPGAHRPGQHAATDETPQHRPRLEPTADDGQRSAQSAPVQPAPPNLRRTGSLRLPAFWLLLGLLAVGGWRTASTMGLAFRAFPVATITAIGLFLVYAIPFVIVARSVDFLEREPPLLLATAAAWGGLVATSTAIPANTAVHDLLAKFVSPAFAASWGPAIAGPTVEELLKTLGVVMIVLIAHRQINSVADGAVYGAFVGLGFQVVENIIYAVNAVGVAGRGDRVGPVIVTFFLRGFLGGLWSHTMFSALAGAGVAYFVVRRNRSLGRRLSVVALAVAGAWSFHFLWNSPLLSDGFGYGTVGVLLALVVKGLPALLMVVLLVRTASGREADFYLDKLAALKDPRVASPAELAALRSGRRRMAARRYAYARCGRAGSSAVGQLQKAQARLAVDISRGGSRTDELTDAVLRQRGRLDSLGHGEALAPPGPVRTWPAILAGLILGVMVAVAVTVAIKALGGH